MDIQTVYLVIVVTEYLCHWYRLGVFLNDYLCKQINDKHEHDYSEYKESGHNTSHWTHKLTGSLCEVVLVYLCGNEHIIDICYIAVGEIDIEVIAVLTEHLTEIVNIHKYGYSRGIIIDSRNSDIIFLIGEFFFESNFISLFNAVFIAVSRWDNDSVMVKFHESAVFGYAINGNFLCFCLVSESWKCIESCFFSAFILSFGRHFENIYILSEHIVRNSVLKADKHRLESHSEEKNSICKENTYEYYNIVRDILENYP